MNISRTLAVVLATFVPAIASAQINQIFGAIHTAQYAITEAKNLVPQQNTPQQQGTQPANRPAPCSVNCPLDPADQAKYDAMQRSSQQEAKTQRDEATKVAATCPALVDDKYNIAERFIRCRNQGLTMPQQMAFVGAMPVLVQAYMASMVQDVYEDNVTSPAKGAAITDYYEGCYKRGTPCVRRKW